MKICCDVVMPRPFAYKRSDGVDQSQIVQGRRAKLPGQETDFGIELLSDYR